MTWTATSPAPGPGGAAIVQGIHQHGYRGYVADDLEGNRWMFAQARPSMR